MASISLREQNAKHKAPRVSRAHDTTTNLSSEEWAFIEGAQLTQLPLSLVADIAEHYLHGGIDDFTTALIYHLSTTTSNSGQPEAFCFDGEPDLKIPATRFRATSIHNHGHRRQILVLNLTSRVASYGQGYGIVRHCGGAVGHDMAGKSWTRTMSSGSLCTGGMSSTR